MQLEECLIDEVSKDNCIIAYEPIWAIGTGQTAEPDDIEEIHYHIRNTLKAKHSNSDVSQFVRRVCKTRKCFKILALPHVGALVGVKV